MSFYELERLCKYLSNKNKQHMEEIRLIKHSILLPHSTKGLQLTDVMKFSWDEPDDNDFQLVI